MKIKILAGMAALLCLSCSQKSPQDLLMVNEKKIDRIHPTANFGDRTKINVLSLNNHS